MLSAAQLRHFSEKGWVIREAVFTAAECTAMRTAGERQLRRLRDAEAAAGDTRDPELWTASGLRSDLTKAWRSRGSWSRTAPDRLTTGWRPPDMSLTPLVAFILPAWPVYGCTGA